MMNNLKIYTKIRCELTAEEWGLYTCTYPAETQQVAVVLNFTLEQVVNSGVSRQYVQTIMEHEMRRNAKYGADDTEPHAALNELLTRIYGQK